MISIEHYLSVDVECRMWMVDAVDVNLENQMTIYLKPVFSSTWLENNKFCFDHKIVLIFPNKKIKVILSKMKESNFVCFDLFSNKW